MQVYYGPRFVKMTLSERERQARMAVLPGLDVPETVVEPFDFGVLDQAALTLQLDVGGSAYWSEIAQMTTLDNLLTQGRISIIDYLERVPNGYISNQQELIDALKERETQTMGIQQQDTGKLM